MAHNDRHGEKLNRLEEALRAAYRAELPLPPLRVEAVMARVRAGVDQGGEARFLWRFLSAAAAAAVLLMAVNWWDGALPETVALNQIAESPWSVLITPSTLN
jgi:hypothetical protein